MFERGAQKSTQFLLFGRRIVGYVTANTLASAANFRLVRGLWSAFVSTRGASLVELRRGETVVTTSAWAGASAWFSGSTLFPWVNRLDGGTWQFGDQTLTAEINDAQNNCANHGLVFDREFAASAQTLDSITLETNLTPDRAYPAHLALAVTYELSDSGLTVTYNVRNADQTRAPFAIGGHPYLLADPDSVLEFNADARIEVDSRLLPSGTSPIGHTPSHIEVANRKHYTDACFTQLARDAGGRASTRLSRPAANLNVTVWQDQSFTHLQVFTLMHPDIAGGQTLLALEPQTAAANALNTGDSLIWLKPGQTWQASWGLVIEEMRHDER